MAIQNILEAYGSDLVGAHVQVGGGGGHTIIDSSGSSLAQESGLQFADAFVEDDSTNSRTVIENIKEHTTASDYDNATEDGFHVIDDGNDVPIGEIEEDVVSVTADGVKTWAQLLNDLNVDLSKITYRTAVVVGYVVYPIDYIGSDCWFQRVDINTPNVTTITYLHLSSNETWSVTRGDTSSSGTTDISSTVLSQGTVISLHYGSSKAIVNLLTNADNCMLDANTSVKQAIVKKTDLTSIIATGSTNATGSAITSGTYFYLNGTLVRAKVDIASGATFTLNTNYEVVTAGALNGLSKVKVQSGLEVYTGVSYDWSYKTITFATPYKTIPLVTVNAPGDTSTSTNHTMPMIDNISETGFRFGWYAKTGTFNVRWQAIGEI